LIAPFIPAFFACAVLACAGRLGSLLTAGPFRAFLSRRFLPRRTFLSFRPFRALFALTPVVVIIAAARAGMLISTVFALTAELAGILTVFTVRLAAFTERFIAAYALIFLALARVGDHTKIVIGKLEIIFL
jgi:hypothetical protein